MKKIPKYIIETLENRASYNYTNKKGSAGYTIDITKWGHYESVKTFHKEIERLVNWVNKNCGYDTEELNTPCAEILYIPTETRYKRMQYATVTIYDPVMRHLEKYISDEPNYVLI